MGPLKQSVFACLTCNPPPKDPTDPYKAAGVCYSCSVQCHGEHTLVEIFSKRNFTCDCGTTRFPATSPCSLRFNSETNSKGGVHSEEPDVNNKYNQNFRNRFCGCECDYDPFQQKGTMFQCLGLGTHETGGCGEDWYHPGCLVGLGPNWFEAMKVTKPVAKTNDQAEDGALPSISEGAEQPANGDVPPVDGEEQEDDDPPMPPGFPAEDDFEGFICYKCVDAHPWIRKYAGTPGFLPAVFTRQVEDTQSQPTDAASPKKRKADDDMEVESEFKRLKSNGDVPTSSGSVGGSHAEIKEEPMVDASSSCNYIKLPATPEGQFSLFLKKNFRDYICRCSSCYANLNPHPQLLEEEEIYEPPISEDGVSEHGSTHGSGSLLERGESALRNVDRVRAIEGVMAYNHLKDKLKPFFQQFAESGKAISADDIKEYFAKLRGDEQAIKDASAAASNSNGDDKDDEDLRREQSGY